MTNKEEFLEICHRDIKRQGIEDLLAWLEKSDFYTAPASTKYHSCHEGGLLEHSLNVYDALCNLLQLHHIDVGAETTAIVALFHDLAKVNLYQKGVKNIKNADTGKWEAVETYQINEKFPCGDHADKSIILIQQYMKLTPDEIFAIRAHMGGWDTSVKAGSYFIGKIFEASPLAVCLHLADMTATYLYENENN